MSSDWVDPTVADRSKKMSTGCTGTVTDAVPQAVTQMVTGIGVGFCL